MDGNTPLRLSPDESDAELLRALRAVDQWHPEPWPRLTAEEGAQVHERLAELADQRAARADAHRKKIVHSSYFFGRDVATGTRLLDDAASQIDRLVYALDPGSPVPIRLVPADDARRIACAAFAVGVREARAR